MSTKIIVLQLKEVIYTAIFVGLGIFLIILLIFMFSPKKKDADPTTNYIPGVYTSSIMLENQAVNVEVIVDENQINSVKLVDLDPGLETLYPLLQPSLEHISQQLNEDSSLEDVSYELDKKHTSLMLIEAIQEAIKKATIPST
ncbi:MAG: hypothetical protein ACLFMO_04240 [Eubacteriales bacterium]